MAGRGQQPLPGTDPHCHILPGVDDGSPGLETSETLLRRERHQGVRQLIFTPHFYANQMELREFLKRRARAVRETEDVCEQVGVYFRVGAEVRLEPELLKMDLGELAIEDTGYLLLEWPFTAYPIWGPEVVERVFQTDNTPIFAHIERYDYFYGNPERLIDYIDRGILCQVNASSLIRPDAQRRILKLIREGYIHLIGTDAHNLDRRPPNMAQAYEVVEKKLGKETLDRLKRNANDLFRGYGVRPPVPRKKKKFF